MPLMVRVDLTPPLRQLLTAPERRLIPSLTRQAINSGASKLRTRSLHAINARTGVPKGKLRRRLMLFRARSNTDHATVWYGSFQWSLASLSKAKLRQAVGGMRRGRFKIGGSFEAEVGEGHVGLFVRGGPKAGRRKAAPRREKRGGHTTVLPIDEALYNPWPVVQQVARYAERKWAPNLVEGEFKRLMVAKGLASK